MEEKIKNLKRIVIKVGSSSITHETGEINLEKIDDLAWECANLRNHGIDVALVSSGAIFAGAHRMNLEEKPKDTPRKQAASAVGQVALMNTYARSFHHYNYQVAQVLLTRMIEENEVMGQNAKNSLDELFHLNVVPIINENDAISTLEIEFGDNDTLSAVVARTIGADLLILLSDIDGLYDKNPKIYPEAKRISKVYKVDEEIYKMAGDTTSKAGTGGMVTKLDAAKLCLDRGISMAIANSEDFSVIRKIVRGENVGTMFIGGKDV